MHKYSLKIHISINGLTLVPLVLFLFCRFPVFLNPDQTLFIDTSILTQSHLLKNTSPTALWQQLP